MNSVSLATMKQYRPVIKQWAIFCSNSSIDPFTASVTDGIEFLTTLFYSKDIGYSSINTARSALSLIIEARNGISFGSHPLVQRYMKGIFRLKPSLPKYTATYDASRVLYCLKQMGPSEALTLKELSMKLAMLLCLLTANRDQVLPVLDITQMELGKDRCVFLIHEIMKTTRPGKHISPVELIAYPYDKELCPVTMVEYYLHRTKKIRGVFIKLFLSYVYPNQPVTTSTLARWCREILKQAGISQIYSSHSTRSAATSKASAAGMSLSELCKAAGWSSSNTFGKFYKRPKKENLGECLLHAYSKDFEGQWLELVVLKLLLYYIK